MAFLKPDKTLSANGLKIKQFFLMLHNPNKIALPGEMEGDPIGITVHNTTSITAAKGTTQAEQYLRSTYNGNMKDVRVHFYVDEIEAWQGIPLNYKSWHAGEYGKPAANGSESGNNQTISIEVIGNSKKAEDNAAKLIAYLMDRYHFETKDIYTHNYWVNIRNGRKAGPGEDLRTKPDHYKGCPVYIIPHWTEFIASIEQYRQRKATKTMYYVQVGAFSSKANAESYLKTAKKDYSAAFIKENGLFYVQVGAFSSKTNAENYLKDVKKQYPKAFIKTMEV